MGITEIIFIGFGLAMDATTVSIGKGLSVQRVELSHILKVGLWFGGFQALMPIIGYLLTSYFADFVVDIDHWIAFGLLLLIGLNMIRETIWGEDEKHNNDFGFRTMILMAIATSIDALAVGVSFAFIHANIWIAASIIGVVTFALSAIGLYLGRAIGSRIGSKAGIVGGLVLIGIGIKILIEHINS
ncbi:MAG: manganese efflux pump [Alistipes sp.]|nr:manganese efflux pump [Alistipes sp.]